MTTPTVRFSCRDTVLCEFIDDQVIARVGKQFGIDPETAGTTYPFNPVPHRVPRRHLHHLESAR